MSVMPSVERQLARGFRRPRWRRHAHPSAPQDDGEACGCLAGIGLAVGDAGRYVFNLAAFSRADDSAFAFDLVG